VSKAWLQSRFVGDEGAEDDLSAISSDHDLAADRRLIAPCKSAMIKERQGKLVCIYQIVSNFKLAKRNSSHSRTRNEHLKQVQTK